MVLTSIETIHFLINTWPCSKDMEKGFKWSENTLWTCLKWITKGSVDSFLLKHMFENCNLKIFDHSVFTNRWPNSESGQFFQISVQLEKDGFQNSPKTSVRRLKARPWFINRYPLTQTVWWIDWTSQEKFWIFRILKTVLDYTHCI